jgi:DNA-binding transcriptional ArsR family regulator
MPPKTIASILNNESNLRILEKLKERPFYPRELAGEMGISEAFIVRRLKAMEEHDIVEGQWETEGGRKVKRYYVQDINMQLGKDGLMVTYAKATPSGRIDLKKEATKLLLILPIILAVFYVINSQNMAIMAATCLYWGWQIFVNITIYRNNPYKSIATATMILVVSTVFLSTLMAIQFIPINLITNYTVLIQLFFIATGFILIIGLIYHIRFSQAEARDMTVDKKDLIANLDSASVPVKLFYLPMVLKWNIGEYFNLH